MAELTSLKNIGKEMSRKLKSVGIKTAEDFLQLGSKETYFRLKLRYPEICLVHLYALEGACENMDFNLLSEEIKQDLKCFSDKL